MGQFLRPRWATGYYNGEVIENLNDFDAVDSASVRSVVSKQLDMMRAIGVNTINLELRSDDPPLDPTPPFSPPTCDLASVLGMQYPRPTRQELTNLSAFFDLVNRKGIAIILTLNNTHMTQPQTENELWLGPILQAIQSKPALYLVEFGGDAHVLDSNDKLSCGIPAEPPLWEGATSYAGRYVKWAIGYAHSLGLPYQKLSAEEIVGFDDEALGLQQPIAVMKSIFEALGVPANQRTYALSWYEHSKCTGVPQGTACADEPPSKWAADTMDFINDIVGRRNARGGARLVAAEFGDNIPVSPSWPTASAVNNLLEFNGR